MGRVDAGDAPSGRAASPGRLYHPEDADPHLHFLVTEGGTDEAGVFHLIPRLDDLRLAEIFAREVLMSLVGKELISPESRRCQ